MKIINNKIYQFNPMTLKSEVLELDKINEGLSSFYNKKVNITNDNLSEFDGDILALCFGFEQSNFKAVFTDNTTFIDSANNMSEFLFFVKQNQSKEIKKVIQL
jgi:F0F1-type ATP synthase alpha subunit